VSPPARPLLRTHTHAHNRRTARARDIHAETWLLGLVQPTLPTQCAIRPTVESRVEIRDPYWEMNDKLVVFHVGYFFCLLFG